MPLAFAKSGPGRWLLGLLLYCAGATETGAGQGRSDLLLARPSAGSEVGK